jgi:translation initiation factor eIF-2B subunit delta
VQDAELAELLGFQLESDLAAAVEAIRADTTSGPVELARRGAEVVLQLTDKRHFERPLHIALEIQGLSRALLEARPDSMPLAALASEAARPLPEFYGRGRTEGARMRGDLRIRIERWLAALGERASRLTAEVTDLLPADGEVATLDSTSSTLRSAFERATAKGKRLRLGPSPAADAQLALATAFAVDGNVIYVSPGTLGLVDAARQANVPCYALAGPEKFVPPNYDFADVGTSGTPRFDRVRLEAWDGIVTGDEGGPAAPEAVQAAIGRLRLESTLL